MDAEEIRDEIARLEEQIERLSESTARCRKFDLASKAAIAAGAVLMTLMVVGAMRFAPLNILGAIAAVLGGIVLYGSNTSTWRETAAALQTAEARRAALIDSMALRDVRTLH